MCYVLRVYSNELVQLLTVLLNNELIKSDADTPLLLTQLAKQLTCGGSRLLFKCTASECQQAAGDELDGDDDEEVRKFAQKYRTDLAKMLAVAARIHLEPFLVNARDWTLRVLAETSQLADGGEQMGSDANSLLYTSWDALIFVWGTLMAVIGKLLAGKDSSGGFGDELKRSLVVLINACIDFTSPNANFTSFNLSLLACLLQMCEHCTSDERGNVARAVFEKLVVKMNFFKSETAKYKALAAATATATATTTTGGDIHISKLE